MKSVNGHFSSDVPKNVAEDSSGDMASSKTKGDVFCRLDTEYQVELLPSSI